MKVLVVGHAYIVDLNRGKWREFVALDKGNQVTVVVPQRWEPGGVQSGVVVSEPVDEGALRVVPIPNFHRSNQSLLCFGKGIGELLRQFRPDVIQVEQTAKALAYAQMIWLNRHLGLKAKNVFFTWWNLSYDLYFPVSEIERYNLKRTDGAICGNQAGEEILRERGYGGPIKVMPQLGVDERIFFPQRSLDLRASLGIAGNEFVIGFIGRLVEEKGLLTLVRALVELRHLAAQADGFNWRCLFIGQGPLKKDLLAAAHAGGIAEQVIFVDPVPHSEVAGYINALDAMVLPSESSTSFKTMTSRGWKEQFGHVLIEAMACKVPVIGSDSGAIPEVVGQSGFVFPEKDHLALARTIRQAALSDDLRKSLSARGYERVHSLYTNKAIARQSWEFYQQLLS